MLLTGASRGIGAALAHRLHTAGARVAMLGLEADQLARVAADCAGAPWRECDVADADALDLAVDALARELGGLDVVVANAGIARQWSVLDGDPVTLETMLRVNTLGVANTIRAGARHISHPDGYLLVVSSLAAAVHLPLLGAYSASKAAAEALGDTARLELAPTGARAGVAYFAELDTDMTTRGFDTEAARLLLGRRRVGHAAAPCARRPRARPGPPGRPHPHAVVGRSRRPGPRTGAGSGGSLGRHPPPGRRAPRDIARGPPVHHRPTGPAVTEPEVTVPRVAPGTRDQLGLPLWALTRVGGRIVGTAPPALFTVLGKHRRLLLAWLPFAAVLMPRGRLPRRDTELVILRIAALRDCAYERAHHTRIARRVGLSDDEIERLGRPDAPGPWTARAQLLLAATGVLAIGGDLDDALRAALRAELTEIECLELIVLVAHYAMLATVISALRIPPDAPRTRPARR